MGHNDAAAFAAGQARFEDEPGHSGGTSNQSLGEATVLVHFDLSCGLELTHISIDGYDADIDCFSTAQRTEWMRSISAELQRDEDAAAADAADAREYA